MEKEKWRPGQVVAEEGIKDELKEISKEYGISMPRLYGIALEDADMTYVASKAKKEKMKELEDKD